ncbi:MAG: hypothetical protein LBC74_09930 [Planctomycetaceae bacterium]|jgi:hypothetical protein|nr:hypothetical protein [Planctomycetaceae bacterium]
MKFSDKSEIDILHYYFIKDIFFYLKKAFGKNWQNEYYIWDCCCKSANLLLGLMNPDQTLKDSLKNLAKVIKPKIYEFDFFAGVNNNDLYQK